GVVYQYFPRLTFPRCTARPLDLHGNAMDAGEVLQPGNIKGELPVTLPEGVCRHMDNGGIYTQPRHQEEVVPGGGSAYSLLPKCFLGKTQLLHLNVGNICPARGTAEECACSLDGMVRQTNFMCPLVGRAAGKHTHRTVSLRLRHPIDHFIKGAISSQGNDPTVALLGSLLRYRHPMSSVLCYQICDIPPFL